jgi:hypothetical protein
VTKATRWAYLVRRDAQAGPSSGRARLSLALRFESERGLTEQPDAPTNFTGLKD